jgi:hypothetical protein
VALGASDEGRLYKAVVYDQTSAGNASPISNPYTFIADIRNTFDGATGTVSLATSSTWTPDPITVVAPANLVGAHYLYEQGFNSEAAMNAAFASGTYGFNVTRTSGTNYTAHVVFSGTKSIPSVAPVITNSTWNAGTLTLQPSAATINYTNPGGYSFTWELVGAHGAGGGGGTATGSLDLTGFIGFGQTYSAEFRLVSTDDSTTLSDPLANHDQNSTYSTLTASIVRCNIQTSAAAANFSIQSAIYTTNGTDYDVLSLLNSKISGNNVVWRMDGNALTNNQSGFTSGILKISYTNADGKFTGSVGYDPSNPSGSYLVLPNPLQAVPEPGTMALLAIGMMICVSLFRRRTC